MQTFFSRKKKTTPPTTGGTTSTPTTSTPTTSSPTPSPQVPTTQGTGLATFGPSVGLLGGVGAVVTPTGSSKLSSSRFYQQKNTKVIGEEKRSSKFSRREAESTMTQTANDAASKIFEALNSGMPALKAFERVAFLMAGQAGGDLSTRYATASNGHVLGADLHHAFSKDPGPKGAAFLLDLLANDGMPSLRAQLWVALGIVDSSGGVARGLAKIPGIGGKLGSKGDTKRIQELFERATAADRRTAWDDPEINDAVLKIKRELHDRLRHLIDVDTKSKAIEDTKSNGGTPTPEQERALAIAKDQQLAQMLLALTAGLPLHDTINKKLQEREQKQLDKSGTGGKAKERHHGWIKFDSKKFYDELVAWKSTATAEDLAQVRKPDSFFHRRFDDLPTNALTGLSKSERTFILNLLGSNSEGGEATQIEAVKGSLERQKGFVGRDDKSTWLGRKVKTALAGKKWRDLITEIKLLSSDQRAKMLAEYDTDPLAAIPKLEADLRAAGLDKEQRAEVRALFNTEFGNIGDNYAELWQIMEPGRKSRIGETLSHLKPTKLSKIGQASKGMTLGKKALKVILHLEGNEWALVRSDEALLGKIKEHSPPEVWDSVLAALGIKAADEELEGSSSREQVHKARVKGEANPVRFAMLLDDAIEENTVGSGVSAGRDKAQLYVIASQAQQAALLLERDDPNNDGMAFLNEILDKLEESSPKKLEYLKKRVPQVYDALLKRQPISTETRIERAKHEGFGVGSKRNLDRQKFEWSFSQLHGRQLLDEWSNLHEFIGLNQGAQDAEKKISTASDVVTATTGATDPADVKRHEQAQSDIATWSDMLGKIHGSMSTFTFGINEARRADMKRLGLKAEDRLKFEGMVSDKLADAIDDDREVQNILDDAKLPRDKFMIAKMKGVDALEMQRHLDTTRQWHQFSTKGSQLSDTTRNVKGSALGTERKLGEARTGGKTTEEIEELRKKGGKDLEAKVEERSDIEARFRDMQDTFRRRAMMIFKLMVTAIVTAIVAAATFGAGTPLGIGLHFGLEAGFAALETAYRYFVLGERDLKVLAIDFGMNLLAATVKVLTGNLTAALNASVLHPDALLQGAEWLGAPIAKGLGKAVESTVMFLPEYLKQKAMQEKTLEKVLKEGEDNIGDEALAQGGKIVKGFVTKIVVAGMKETKGLTMGAITGETPTGKPVPKQRTFDQAYNDRLMGGGSPEEQEQMWGRYQKGKQKEAKKAVKQEILKGEVTERTKKSDESRRKDELKEARKVKSTGTVKAVTELVQANVKAFRTARGFPLVELLTKHGVSVAAVQAFGEDDKEELEELMHMNPGQLDRELTLPPEVALLLNDLEPWAGLGTGFDIGTLIENDNVDGLRLMRLPVWQLKQLALSLGQDPAEFARKVRVATNQRALRRMRPPTTPPPEPPTGTTRSRPPKRPPPPVPTKPRQLTGN